jgi:hypothetical protein
MKRMWIIIISVLVMVAPVLAIIPAVAGDSSDGIKEGNNQIIEPHTSFNALTGNGRSTSAFISSPKSAIKSSYTPLIAHAGEPLVFIISAADPDNNPLIYTASNLPPGATFDPLTRTFSWTPGYDQAGIYTNIHFEVSDGELTDSEDITITVINFNRPPILNGIGNKSVTEQKPLEFTVNATDPDNDILMYSTSNLPSGATFNPQTRTFSWTPNAGQQGTYAGIHFEASDGKLADFEDITITVTSGSGDQLPPAAVFSVSALSINPDKVSTGKKVNIRVIATNSGSVAGNYEVTLKINGVIEATKLVTISPRTSVNVSFTAVRNVAGVYIVDINGLSGSFLIITTNKPSGGKA